MKFDDNSLPLKTCDNCGSDRVWFNAEFRFYKCETCRTVWACDEDDPDYDELIDESSDKYAYYGSDITPDEATTQ
jgi:hypothetical protein